MSNYWNFIKNQASSVANALTYGLTHLDQFSTAGDVIVVQHPDGTLHSTPFNVRFGKLSVPRPQTKVVQIQVNGNMVSAVMKLRSDGSAYFIESTNSGNGQPISPTTSAISPPRSPTLNAASSPTTAVPTVIGSNLELNTSGSNNQNQPTKSNSNGNDEDDDAQQLPPQQGEEIVTVDEGSAVEIAKKNPEFRDLVTSMLGEGRENALQESFAAAAANNGSFGNSSINSRPSGHARVHSSNLASAAAATGGASASLPTEPTSGQFLTGTSSSSPAGQTPLDTAAADGISPMQRQATATGIANSSGVVDISTNLDQQNNNNNNESTGTPLLSSGGGGGVGHSRSFSNAGAGLRLSRFASSDNVSALNDLIANDGEFAALVKEMGGGAPDQMDGSSPGQKKQQLQLAPSMSRLTAGSEEINNNNNNNVDGKDSSPNSVLLDQTNNNVPLDSSLQHLDNAAAAAAGKNKTPEIVAEGQNAASPDFRGNNNNPEQNQPSQQHQQGFQMLPHDQAGSQIIDDGDFVDDSSDDDYDYFYQPTQNNNSVGENNTNNKIQNNNSNQEDINISNNNNTAENLNTQESVNYIGNEGPENSLDGSTIEQQDILQGSTAGGNNKKNHIHATTTPGHNELAKLGLKDGANIVKFIVYSTTLTRSVEVEARIFLWPYTAKVIISDIDGTVTKSDVMGHLSAILRWDWTHPGLCSLYTNIAKNEYKFLYLTARSLSQTSSTRNFLESIVQDGQKLPDGPVFTATEKLFAALTQEVLKRSHIFKTNCLKEVRAIFPKSLRHPLYAGFGNRIGDSIAYENVGIPLHKIFIIDESSVVHVCKVKQSYRDLSHLVDMTFPPISGKIPVHASQLPIHYSEVSVNRNGQTYTTANSDSPDSSIGATVGSVASLGGLIASVSNNNNTTTSPALSSSSYQQQQQQNQGGGTNISPQTTSPRPSTTGHFPTNHTNSSEGSLTRSPPSSSEKQQNNNNSNSGVGVTTIGGSGDPLPPPITLSTSASSPTLGLNNTVNGNTATTSLSSTSTKKQQISMNHPKQNPEDAMMEEKVDFNEFNYWRVDPSTLVAPAKGATTTSAESTTGSSGEAAVKTASTTAAASTLVSPSRPTNKGSASGLSIEPPTAAVAATSTNEQQNHGTSTTPRSNSDTATNQEKMLSASNNQHHQDPNLNSPNPTTTSNSSGGGWFGGWFSRSKSATAPPEQQEKKQEGVENNTATSSNEKKEDEQKNHEDKQQEESSSSSSSDNNQEEGETKKSEEHQEADESKNEVADE